MTGKEIILKALRFEEVPRIPVALLDGYVWMLRREGLSFKDICEMEDGGAPIVIRAYDEIQTDIVQPNLYCFNYIFEIMGGTIRCDKKGEPFEVVTPPLKTMADIDKYDVNDVWEKFSGRAEFQSCLHLLEKLNAHYKDDRLVVAVAAGPFSLAGMLMGVQHFMLEIYEEEEYTAKLLDFATELAIRICEAQVAHGADAIFFAEPVASGDLISPAMFEEFALPYIQKFTAAMKKFNLPIMLHMCGHTKARLEPLKEAGIDAFSLAAVDLKEALEIVDSAYAIIGNMDPFEVMQSMTSEQVYETCKGLGEIAGLKGGYIMAPGCDLPPASPLENVQAMIKAAHDKTA